MISACVFLTVKHGGGGVLVWGALLMTLYVIYFEFKAHLTSMATTVFCSEYAIPSGLGLVGLSFVFQQDNDPTQLQAV
jgi:hypothetical protein